MIWSEEQIFQALRRRLGEEEWVVLPQVRAATGGYVERTADAVAMNCWRSRGLVIHGFEMKSSRSDWLRELRKPAKQEQGIYPYCHRWWLAVGDASIVKSGELPETWGLMAPKGDRLVVSVKAPKLKPQDPTRAFVASLLRNVRDKAGLPQQRLDAAYKAGLEAGRKQGITEQREREAAVREGMSESHSRLLEVVRAFQDASGLSVNQWDAGRIGQAVKLLMHQQDPLRIFDATRRAYAQQESIASEAMKKIDQAVAELAAQRSSEDLGRRKRKSV